MKVKGVYCAFLVLWLAACSKGGDSGDSCTSDQDCPPGRYCKTATGECVYDCNHDEDCPGFLKCSGRGRCECIETNGGEEVCDGEDNDCDGQTDEGFDQDGDGYSACDLDCDDGDPDTYTGAAEQCDGRDNDCDGATDGDLAGDPCTIDNNHGSCEGLEHCIQGEWICDAPEAAPEECDGHDNDCDGLTDEFAPPTGLCETGFEIGDNRDNNCDGLTDEIGGCMKRVIVGEVDVYVDLYENTVFDHWDCTGQRYGLDSDDFPNNWPADDRPATVTLYACSLPGIRPSRYLSLFQARRACQAQDKRLCTKAEWSVACGGDELLAFTYGDSYDEDICNTFSAGTGDTVETGSFEDCVSPVGTYDMSGNLWEWVEDFCPWDIDQHSVQGGAFICEYCDEFNVCVPCDMSNPDHQGQIDQFHRCHYPGGSEVCVASRTAQSSKIGFRCCKDPL